ncbi:MAG: TonB-dependent receptor, partial [Alphaproteobacteria bacterium]|nr:TonB-dependent receptor [Alphaproteobacteria bacterium]
MGQVVIRFGAQAGLNIGLTDERLAQQISPGVHGRHDIYDALRILLRGTGAAFLVVGPRTVRIILSRLPIVKPAAPRPAQSPPIPHQAVVVMPPPDDIIVTASKRQTPLANFAGTVSVVNLKSNALANGGVRGTDEVTDQLPILASTQLGSGRDKIFIRGIADSSFNGSSQSTAALYLGEARMTYNSPDPDLILYDVDRVEVIEGPQNTLYGNGAIGGVVRFEPAMPTTKKIEADFTAGASSTQHGGIGEDVAASLNLPVINDRLAVRAVTYHNIDAGYINDPVRNLAQINRSTTAGGRISLHWTPSSEIQVDAGVVYQNIESADGNYVYAGAPDLVRASRVAQPFGNKYALAYVSLVRKGVTNTISATTSFVRQSINTTYDATDYSDLTLPILSTIPRIFQNDENITMVSHETRIFGNNQARPWLLGVSGMYTRENVARAIGPPSAPSFLDTLGNQIGELALFGEYS